MEELSLLEKRTAHIKELIKREHINQRILAEMINRDPVNLSRDFANNKVSEKTCNMIKAAFPESDYNIQWLLGYNDYPTENEKWDAIYKQNDIVTDCLWGIIEKSLNKKKKTLKFHHRQNQHLDSRERFHADCYYTIEDMDGHELKRMTADEMYELEKQLLDYCDFITRNL